MRWSLKARGQGATRMGVSSIRRFKFELVVYRHDSKIPVHVLGGRVAWDYLDRLVGLR